MEKKSFLGGINSVIDNVSLKDLEKSYPETKEETAIPKKKVGRPTINRQEVTKTTKEGLREGLDRMTIIIRDEFKDKLKYCSYMTRKPLWTLLDEAIEDYLAKYESLNGKIDN